MSKIVVFINGKPCQVEETASITGLLSLNRLDPKMILIEHNQRALLRSEWPGVSVRHGDRFEFVRVVAGG